MKFFIAVALLFSSLCFAENWDNIKESFSPLMLKSTAQFDKAETMKTIDVPLGKEISKDECTAFLDKIRPNYKLDPFHLDSSTANYQLFPCGAKWGTMKNYLSDAKGFTNFHRPYASVLQRVGYPQHGSKQMTSYFLDENNAVIEIQTLYFDSQTLLLEEAMIQSLDEAGNLYLLDSSVRMGPPGQEGQTYITHVVMADGTSRMIRQRVLDKDSKQNKYMSLNFKRADTSDWNSVQMMITYNSLYYLYDGKPYDINSKPTNLSSLTINYLNGKELCASGEVRTAKGTQFYPNDKAYNNCR